MGGGQQFLVLLRKNLLLKTRRPWATFFELLMPIVLFALLGHVRNVYEIQGYGPHNYARETIFPMSRKLLGSLIQIDSFNLGGSASLNASNFTRDLLCNKEAANVTTSLFEHMLNVHIGNKTAMQWLLELDTQSLNTTLNRTRAEIEGWNVSVTVGDLTKFRDEFLASDLLKAIFDLTDRFDNETKRFQTYLDLGNGSALAEQRLQELFEDTCDLRGPVFAAYNTTSFVRDVVRMRNSTDLSDITRFFNSTNISQLMQPFYDLLNMVSQPNSSTVTLSGSLNASLLSLNAETAALMTDDIAWWLSHFLKSRSITARLLGEDSDDLNWAKTWTDAFQDRIPVLLRTKIAEVTYIILKDLQRIQGNSTFSRDIGPNISRSIDHIRENSGYLERNASSAWSNITSFWSDMLSYNLTYLENHTVPDLNRWWRAECPKVLNRSLISSMLNRTFRNCPWFRGNLRNHEPNSTAKLNETIRHLTFNSTDLTSTLSELQKNFTGNVTDAINRMINMIAGIQSLQTSVKNISSKDSAKMLFEGLRDELLLQLKLSPCSSASSDLNMNLSAILGLPTWLTGSGSLPGVGLATSGNGNGNGNGNQNGLGNEVEGWMTNELMRRKLIVAPYQGEAKEFFDAVKVELALSIIDPREWDYSIAKALFRCPAVRAATAKIADLFLQDRMLTFATTSELVEYAKQYPDNVLAGITIENADQLTGNFPPGPLSVVYKIRMHAQLLPPTDRIMKFSRYSMFGAARQTQFYAYIALFFPHVQEVLGRAIARLRVIREERKAVDSTVVGTHVAAHNLTMLGREFSISLEQFPNPYFEIDGFIRIIQHTLPMLAVLGWIYAVSLLVKQVVYEKQERLRDVMRIMGLKTWVYWASWVTSAMIQLGFLVLIMVTILSVFKVLKYSDPTVVFLFFWLFSAATVSLSMLISAFFSRAKVAAACAGMIYYGFYMPYSFYTKWEEAMSLAGKNCLCLLSSTSMGIGMSMIAKWELVEEGLQWSNVAKPIPVTYSGAAPKDSHCMAHVMMMLVVDVVVYQALAWYVEKVNPGTLGLPQPWYFPILPSYWCPRKPMPQVKNEDNSNSEKSDEQADNKKLECWEAAPPGCRVIVRIRNLVKVFKAGKRALAGISLDMHEGMIVGLLGHNGAGKSTTMAILTGLYGPTSGDVEVNGISVRKDSQGVRNQLGVCLQHNALYDSITVQEHLRLFCCLKSVPYKELTSAIENLVNDIGLSAKRHAQSMSLSGGMKRKLSIGIALAGNPKVVALDEPTAGVDATSRREIWQLLAKHKANRTILLSTHFMDEADILSDRIAIIAEGQLTAIGSGMSLKRHFAEGYILTIVTADGANIPEITRTIRASVPEASCAGARGREYSYILPFAVRYKFPQLFAQLQDPSLWSRLGIEAHGLSAASMEEVFLQASSLHEEGLHGKVRNNAGEQGELVDPKFAARDTSRISQAETAEIPAREGSSTSSGSGKDSRSTPTTEVSPERENSSGSSTLAQKADTPNSDRQTTPQLCEVQTVPPPQLSCDAEIEPTPEEVPKPIKEAPPQKTSDGKSGMESTDKTQEEEKSTFTNKTPLKGSQLVVQQFWALLIKRAHSVRRDRKAWISQLALPACFVFLALIVAAIMSVKEEMPPLKISTDMLLGTTSAGAVVKSLSEHVIPVTPSDGSMMSEKYMHGMIHGKGAGDRLLPIGANESMHNYIMQRSKDLSQSFGALDVNASRPSVNLYFKNQAYHAIPVMANLWNNMRFQALGFQDTSVEVWNHPLPKTSAVIEQELSGQNQAFTDLSVAITVILAMGFIPASFVVFIVHEKASSGKHQQLLAGVSPVMYWVSSYAWDMINFFFPLVLCFLIFQIFQVAAFSGDNSLAIFLLLLLYGACMTPLMYCIEPLFSTPSTAYVTLICLNIFTGFISVLSTTVMDLYQNEVTSLKRPNKVLKALSPWLLPNYSLGRGLIDIATNHYINYAAAELRICPSFLKSCYTDPLTWNVAGKFLTSLLIMTPVWLGLRLLFESDCCCRRLRPSKRINAPRMKVEDEAVHVEAKRVNDMTDNFQSKSGGSVDELVISNLSKSFVKRSCCRQKAGPVHAVRGICVGVPRGECFGLLGVNGAGKTTTMKMVTSDIQIGNGDILVGGWSVNTQRNRARSHLGYCPQFDALPDKLTVWETLALYARIRAIPQSKVKAAVHMMVKRMCLEAHQYKMCEHLSGGNKRKLSTALALIGEPDVVLLDEPSTGVDVGARRFLWDIVSSVRTAGHAVVLTSHSMEECEVLCTRLTIMVHGQFRCLGTPLQLKDKYGAGYTLSIKANVTSDPNEEQPTAKIRAFMEEKMPNATLNEESVGLLRYHLQNMNKAEGLLGSTFNIFEKAIAEGGVLNGAAIDYTMSQTSLEEVFLYFSQLAEDTQKDLNKVDNEEPAAPESRP